MIAEAIQTFSVQAEILKINSTNVSSLTEDQALEGLVKHHNAVAKATAKTLKEARHAGEHLMRLRELRAHGEWVNFLKNVVEQQFGISQRTANRYLRIAQNWDELTNLFGSDEAVYSLTWGVIEDALKEDKGGEKPEPTAGGSVSTGKRGKKTGTAPPAAEGTAAGAGTQIPLVVRNTDDGAEPTILGDVDAIIEPEGDDEVYATDCIQLVAASLRAFQSFDTGRIPANRREELLKDARNLQIVVNKLVEVLAA